MVLRSLTLNDGKSIPILAFGTGTAQARKDSTAATLQAIQNGWRHLDCAWAYRNQSSVGEAIRQSGLPREELFITSKCGDFEIAPLENDIRAMLLDCLRDLGVDYLDLFLIHSDVVVDSVIDSWKIMEQLQQEGLTRSIGLSNFHSKNLQLILDTCTIKPAVHQVEFHPYALPTHLRRNISICKAHDILIECYGPLVPVFRKRGGPVDKVVQAIAVEREQRETEGQILLAWAQQMSGGVVITTTTNAGRLIEQMKPFLIEDGLPLLSHDEMSRITSAGKEAPFRHWMKMIANEDATEV